MTLAPKGTESGLREASWEEALELVSTKLRETWKKDKSRLAFLGQRPAAYYGRLPYREVLEGRSAFQQYRSERAHVHGERRRRLHERVPDRRARRLL